MEANVKILKELGKSGKKEKMAMDEVRRSPTDSLPTVRILGSQARIRGPD